MDEESEAPAKYDPEKFAVKSIFPNGNSFICLICNKQISQSESIHAHIWHTYHLTKFKQICNNYAKTDDRVTCKLCADYTAVEWKDFLIHFHEREHFEHLDAKSSSQNSNVSYIILFNNQIIETKPGIYNCCSCQKTKIAGNKLIGAHIVEKPHKELKEIRIRDQNTEQLSESVCKKFVQNSVYILTSSNFHCYICNCSVSGLKNVSEHIDGACHAKNLSEKISVNQSQRQLEKLPKNMSIESFAQFISDNSITRSFNTNKYKCNLCSCTISGAANVPQHVRSRRHNQSIEPNCKEEKSATRSKSSGNGEPIENSSASLKRSKSSLPNCGLAKNITGSVELAGSVSSSSDTINTVSFYRTSQGATESKTPENLTLKDFAARGIFLIGDSFLCLICYKPLLHLEGIAMHMCGTGHCKKFEKISVSCAKNNGQAICKLCTSHPEMEWKDFLIHFHEKKHFENFPANIAPKTVDISYVTLLNNQIIETRPGVYSCCSCTKEIIGINSIGVHIVEKKHKQFRKIRNKHFPVADQKETDCRKLVKNWFSVLTSTNFHCYLCNCPAQGLPACYAHICSIDHVTKLMQKDNINRVGVTVNKGKRDRNPSSCKLPENMTEESFVELICDNFITGPSKNGQYKCNLCVCMLSGPLPIFQHVSSQRHIKLMDTNGIRRKSTNKSESSGGWELTENSSASWETCESSSQSYDRSESLSGNWESSENALNTWETISNAGSYSALQGPTPQFEIPQNLIPLISKKLLDHREREIYCIPCGAHLRDQQSLFDHTNSRNHIARLNSYKAKNMQQNEKLPVVSTKNSVTNNKLPINLINEKSSELTMNKTTKSTDTRSTTSPEPLLELPKRALRIVKEHSLQHLKREVYCPSCDVHLRDVGSVRSHTKSKRHIDRLKSSSRPREKREANEIQVENIKNSPILSENKKNSAQNKLTKDKFTKPSAKPIRSRYFDPKYLEDNMQHIYKFNEEKLRIIKLSCQSCFPKKSNTLYCLTCEKIIANRLQTFYEHICCSSHIAYLTNAEREDKHFINYQDQFSTLTLAKEFMQAISEQTIHCYACDTLIDDDNAVILKHLKSDSHNACKQPWKREMEKIQQTILLQMEGTWYNIQKYWCQPCDIEFRAEFHFAEHMEGKKHASRLKKMNTLENRLVFDACTSCATLWLGFGGVYTDHCQQPLHKYLVQSGDYSKFALLPQAKGLLEKAEIEVNRLINLSNQVLTVEKKKAESLLKCLEDTVKPDFPDAKAHPFGSRVSGLGFPDSDIDVFLDCVENNDDPYMDPFSFDAGTYNGDKNSENYQKQIMKSVGSLLRADEESWEIHEILESSRTPIIKLRHRATELSCDVSFKNGLSVENTKLLKCYIDNFPLCRKLMLFLKKWLSLCNLSGSQYITNYAICWYVIFYLQAVSILPSVGNLIARNDSSSIIDNWETGICEKFDVDQQKFTFTKLLREFFIFYNNFDFRNSVACPLLGKAIPKEYFPQLHLLPEEMTPYINHITKNSACGPVELFRIDSEMCIQDPYDLSHNLTKAVQKFTLYRFRQLSALSAEILNDSSKKD